MVAVHKVLETMCTSCYQVIPLQGVNDLNLHETLGYG
jgi:hypothetical protein